MKNTILFFFISLLSFQITSAQTPELWGMTAQGGVQDYGTVFKINGDGSDFWKVHDFTVKNPGIGPYHITPLLYEGWLYGVTHGGSWGNGGILFKYHPGENQYVPVHFFSYDEGQSPSGSLMLASNGKMYGVTWFGGNGGQGTLYEFDPITEQLLVKFNFDPTTGSSPSGKLVEKDGYLYGLSSPATNGYYSTLYRFNLSTQTHETLHNFSLSDGGYTTYCDLLLASDGKFYGKAFDYGMNTSGTLFSFNPANNSFAVVHHFNSYWDGVQPQGNLIEFTNGKIIGTATAGGPLNTGTVFKYDISTGIFSVLYQFGTSGGSFSSPGNYLTINSDGWVYGTVATFNYSTTPYIFRFYPDSTEPEGLAQLTSQDFNTSYPSPNSALTDYGDGWLYSYTGNGGVSQLGTLYRLNPTTFEVEKLIDLNETISVHPFGSLIVSQNGKFYGIGGYYNYDFNDSFSVNHPEPAFTQYSMFEIDPLSGSFKKVAPETPWGFGVSAVNSLTAGSDHQVYGISVTNFANVFRYDPLNDTSEVFLNVSTYYTGPIDGDLTQANNGMLYGLSTNGGYISGNPAGIIFRIDPVNKTFHKVFSFEEDVTGYSPTGSLLQASDELLYGMTKKLGPATNVGGTIFRYDIAADTFKKLHEFIDPINGRHPLGSLVEGIDGYLYGMTSKGGNFGYGVIFRFNKTTNQFTKLRDFDGELEGGSPQGSLLQASNGQLYGMTLHGGLNDKGVIFKFDPELLLYEVIGNFTGNENGALPHGNLVEYHGSASVIYTMADTAACLGSDITLLAVGTGGYLYHEWFHDGIPVGGNTQALLLTSVTYADSGKYWCNIYNDLGNTVSDTIHLKVIEPPIASLSIIGADMLCPYDAPVELVGSPAGGVYSGAGVYGNSFYPSYAGPGIHYPLYTYSYGCISNDSIAITVGSVPQISFTSLGDTTLCLADPAIVLIATPSGGSFFGDGVNGNSFNPSIAGVGTHFIYYTYTDTCTATDSISITVNLCTGIADLSAGNFSIDPNPFTDVLKVSLSEKTMGTKTHFRIMDHLGKVVAEGKISSPTFFIHRNQLAAGLYLLVIESEEMVTAKKIVIE